MCLLHINNQWLEIKNTAPNFQVATVISLKEKSSHQLGVEETSGTVIYFGNSCGGVRRGSYTNGIIA